MGGLTILVGAIVLAGGGDKSDFRGPGWYQLRLEPNRDMVLRIVDASEGSYSCLYQGFSMTVAKDRIVAMQSISHSEKSPSGMDLSGAQHAKVLYAIDELAHPDFQVRRRAYSLLRKRFPACRPAVHLALTHLDRRVRALSVKLLGESGDATEDWTAAIGLLSDPDSRVRLASVMALRRMEPRDVEPLVEYLRSEPVANNRKMAVRNLERWKDPDAVKGLIGRLRAEEDHGVRVFVGRALKALTGQDHGDDTDAWETFLQTQKKEQHDV